VKLNLEGKGVQDINDTLCAHKHLRDVNLSHNDILDVQEIARLEYIVNLQATHNRISSISFLNENSISC
jgi:hypothetical protein